MRLLGFAFGILVALVGGVWTLQGLGILLGSFMSNDPTWIWIGSATAVFGVGLIAFSLVSRPLPKSP